MNDAELAILSIVAEAPKAGLDVQTVIDERNVRLWTMIGVESIYYVIEKLERQGLIENIDEQPPDNTRLKMYRITQAGIGILQTAITDLLSSARHLPHSFDIGLANLPVLQTSQVRSALVGYRSGLQMRHDSLTEQHKTLQNDKDTPFHILSLFEHQIAMLQAEIAWFDDWMPNWEAQAPEDEELPPRAVSEGPRMEQAIMPDAPDSFHKKSTIKHDSVKKGGVEYPPPPDRRSPKTDKTQVNQETANWDMDEE